jgi:hypothetical protein
MISPSEDCPPSCLDGTGEVAPALTMKLHSRFFIVSQHHEPNCKAAQTPMLPISPYRKVGEITPVTRDRPGGQLSEHFVSPILKTGRQPMELNWPPLKRISIAFSRSVVGRDLNRCNVTRQPSRNGYCERSRIMVQVQSTWLVRNIRYQRSWPTQSPNEDGSTRRFIASRMSMTIPNVDELSRNGIVERTATNWEAPVFPAKAERIAPALPGGSGATLFLAVTPRSEQRFRPHSALTYSPELRAKTAARSERG